jgi:hypothetical protein
MMSRGRKRATGDAMPASATVSTTGVTDLYCEGASSMSVRMCSAAMSRRTRAGSILVTTQMRPSSLASPLRPCGSCQRQSSYPHPPNLQTRRRLHDTSRRRKKILFGRGARREGPDAILTRSVYWATFVNPARRALIIWMSGLGPGCVKIRRGRSAP